jgi:enterochelin esterase family protein
MKTAWSGLLIGMSTLPAAAMNCESPSLQGELEEIRRQRRGLF